MTFYDVLNKAILELREKHDADFLIYSGEISRRGADLVAARLHNKQHRNLVMLLATYGGDSNAAFKIARCCQTAYNTLPTRQQFAAADPNRGKFTVYVPRVCKSAGTIITLGADVVMMDTNAELGPIDIQLRKQDEVGELTSTLTPVQAIQSLHKKMADAFVETFTTLRFDERSSFSSKMAGELAGNLVGALVGPISSQIDPYRLAETERMLRISHEYGTRLDVGNLNAGTLDKLVHGYPSHGYVIDLAEAKELFKNAVAADPMDPIGRLSNLLDFLWRERETSDPPDVRIIDLISQSDDEAPDSAEPAEEDAEPAAPRKSDTDSKATVAPRKVKKRPSRSA